MKHALAVTAALVAVVLVCAAPSLADQAAVTIAAPETTLKAADGGGGTATISLTNLTDQPVSVEVRPPTTMPECSAKLSENSLPPAQTTSVDVTIASTCGTVTKALKFTVAAPPLGSSLPFTVKPAASEKPNWGALSWFVSCTFAALALMFLVYWAWMSVSGVPIRLWASLPSLDDSWTFKDSWVSNVTVIGGLLAGVFGSSSVVKAMLGADADAAVALATIGGAISVAHIGAAGVIALLFKTPAGGKFTALGVLLGSAVALGAAGGQLGVVFESAKDLDLGGRQDHLTPYLVATLVLLTTYGFFSVLSVLIQGHQDATPADPFDEPVSDTMLAAAVLAAAMCADGCVDRDAVDKRVEDLRKPAAPTIRARSAPLQRWAGARGDERPHRVVKALGRSFASPSAARGRSALP